MPFPILPSNSASGYNLTKSLRFRNSANAYLNRSAYPTSSGTKYTFSVWLKFGTLASVGVPDLLCFVDTGNSRQAGIGFTNAGTGALSWWEYAGSYTLQKNTSQLFRDPSAWYHIICVWDSANATADDRAIIYVNGVRVTAFSTNTNPAQNTVTQFSNGTLYPYLGAQNRNNSSALASFDGEMAEINFIDGQSLPASSFGSFNTLTGVWQPAKYTGTYGTNGFYLPFTNTTSTSTLGNDFSGNGNNWTTNNFSLTAGSTYDSMTDVPTLTNSTTANYAVLNPLRCGSLIVPTQGNLSGVCTGTAAQTVAATFGVSSGKYYWEVTNTGTGLNYIGIVDGNAEMTTYIGSAANGNGWAYNTAGQKVGPTAGTAVAYGATYANGDLIGVALDMDAGTIVFYKNNSSQGTMVTGLTGTWFPAVSCNGLAGNGGVFNFGQRPFTYTPPTGFVALNAFNLPTSTIVEGNTYMDVTTYTGNGSAGRVITMSNMTNVGFAWVKLRSGSDDHRLANTVTGGNKHLQSNSNGAESSGTNVIQAFSGNTFTIGSDNSVNVNGSTYVGWVWANDGTSGSSNTNGTITSTVSVNASAGFSVVTYSANGSTGTVGHGLGVAPSMIIVKKRNAAERWCVYHISTSNAYIYLNETFAAETTNANVRFGNNSVVVQPTSSVFTIGSSNDVNGTSGTYVAYCWSEIAGFSKFGSYVGNGSADGTFVYTGFRPKFVMFKRSSSTGDWGMWDTSRNTYNESTSRLSANSSAAELNQAATTIDILSNGVKFRTADSDINASGSTYIYMAFAENPFKNALAR